MHVHLHILQVKFDSRLKLNFICFWLIIIKCNKYREKKLKTNPQKIYIFVGALAYLSQWGIVMRLPWTSLFSNMAEIDSAPRLNVGNHDKKSASVTGKVMSRQILTRFDPDKKSAVLGQKIG